MSTEESKKDWSKMTVDQLRTELRARGLSATGRKADLVARLENGGNGNASPATATRAATPRKAAGKRKQKEADEEDDEDDDDEESEKKEKKSSKDSSDSSSEEEEEEKKPKAKKSKKTAATPAAAAWVPNEKGNWAPPVTDDDSKFMKLISWNLNGLNAVHKKGHLVKYVRDEDPDVICFQETKTQTSTAIAQLLGNDYPHEYWNHSATKLGYAGTATFSKVKPVSVTYGIGIAEHDGEGRVITTEFDRFYLVNTYIPNAGQKLERLGYRQEWNKDFLAYLKNLEQTKPVVWCGDLNVAHHDIDIANPKTNQKTAGFTKEERRDFGQLLESGFVDTFRHQNPDLQQFTYWSNRFNCRAKNLGWRLDYFVVSKDFLPECDKSFVRPNALGSDHCPIGLLVRKAE